MRGSNARRERRERGQALALFALSITMLLGMASLAVDVGRLLAQQRYLQNAADAAALAAAKRAVVLARSGGGTIADARTYTVGLLAQNLAKSPAGAVTGATPDQPVYSGGGTSPANLIDGILFTDAYGRSLSGSDPVGSIADIRVAARSRVDFMLARALGVQAGWTVGKARVGLKATGNLMPIAVRRYVGGAGPNSPVPAACPEDPADQRTWFFDLAASWPTACLGSLDATQPTGYNGRSAASVSAPGPITELVGQGAQASGGGISFRGFINLDVRNFQTDVHRYYNGLTAATGPNAVKNQESGWVVGYPGPPLGPIPSVPDGSNQVGILDGNSAGKIVAAMDQRFQPNDVFLAALYDGTVRTIPAFLLRAATAVPAIPTTGVTRTGTLEAVPDKSFDDYVQLSVLGVPAGLSAAVDATEFTPNYPQGTSKTVSVSASTGTSRIDTFWVKGIDTNRPNNLVAPDYYLPVPVTVGNVPVDFTWTPRTPTVLAASDGSVVTLPVVMTTTGLTDYSAGNTVTLRLVENRQATAGGADPAETMPAGSYGFGTVGTTTATVALTTPLATTKVKGKTTTTYTGTVQLRIDSSKLPAIRSFYTIPVEMTATTSGGLRIRHLDLLRVNMAEASNSRNYVEIIGFAAYQITAIDANTVWGRIISPIDTNPDSPRLLAALTPRLIPW